MLEYITPTVYVALGFASCYLAPEGACGTSQLAE
jgi:hypothetical protein